MSSGFIKLNREGGLKLLEGDPNAFLLLTQIAFRAKRTNQIYSPRVLKQNQAFIGDCKTIGLSPQQYKTAKKNLVKYELAVFESTNRGTIATLISTDVFDINAEETADLIPKN